MGLASLCSDIAVGVFRCHHTHRRGADWWVMLGAALGCRDAAPNSRRPWLFQENITANQKATPW